MFFTEHDISTALANAEVVPYFQPLVKLHTAELVGFEILARWQHPEHGVLLPPVFLPIVEKSGLSSVLTEQLLSQAFSAARALPSTLGFSVNISPTQLTETTLVSSIESAAVRSAFPLSRLTVEITESALLEHPEQAQDTTARLKSFGIGLSLDDFGTGYSSLTHLQALPFDELKIDQSFVRSMLTNKASRKIVAAVIGLGESLNLTTVAEGVEKREQADMLLCLGCKLGQVWLFGKPLSASQLQEFCERRTAAQLQASRESEKDALSCIEALPAQRYAHLRAIYDGAPVGLCFLDRELRYVNLNQRLAELQGLTVKQHLGRSVQEVCPGIYDAISPLLQRALKGETSLELELQLPTSTGAETANPTLLFTCQPGRDESDDVLGVSLAVIDISARKQAERELKESEEHYRYMVELNPQFPWTLGPDGSLLDVSPRWESLTGISSLEAKGDGWLGAVHPEDRQRLQEDFYKALEVAAALDCEYRVGRGDDAWHWVRSRGAPRRNLAGDVVRWYGSTEIIDDRKKAFEDLQRSQCRLQAIIDALPIGMVIAEAPTGRIVSRNPAAELILAQDPSNLREVSDYGERIAYYSGGRRLRSEDFPIARALRDGATTEAQQVFFDGGCGPGKHLLLRGAPFLDAEGKIAGAVALIEEVRNPAQGLQQRPEDSGKALGFNGRCSFNTSQEA